MGSSQPEPALTFPPPPPGWSPGGAWPAQVSSPGCSVAWLAWLLAPTQQTAEVPLCGPWRRSELSPASVCCTFLSLPRPGRSSASVAPVLKGVEILQPCSLAQRSLPCAGQDRRVLVACQAPLSVEFSRQEYWTGLPFPAPGDFPDSGIEPPSLASLALAGRFFTATWEAPYVYKLSSVAQSCLTLRDPMNRSTPDLPVHHKLPEFTQTHAHRVGDAIQPSHPLSSPSPPAPNLSQHQGLFQ